METTLLGEVKPLAISVEVEVGDLADHLRGSVEIFAGGNEYIPGQIEPMVIKMYDHTGRTLGAFSLDQAQREALQAALSKMKIGTEVREYSKGVKKLSKKSLHKKVREVTTVYIDE